MWCRASAHPCQKLTPCLRLLLCVAAALSHGRSPAQIASVSCEWQEQGVQPELLASPCRFRDCPLRELATKIVLCAGECSNHLPYNDDLLCYCCWSSSAQITLEQQKYSYILEVHSIHMSEANANLLHLRLQARQKKMVAGHACSLRQVFGWSATSSVVAAAAAAWTSLDSRACC